MDYYQKPFDIGAIFSENDIEYTLRPEKYNSFISYLPNLDGLKEALKTKKNTHTDRVLLHRIISKQYQVLSNYSEEDQLLIDHILESSTFTVTTAHQPCLFTGPLYFIYKAISAIVLARRLQEVVSDHKILPIFVLGGEDHDKEEINHLHLFGKTITWETNQNGAFGRFNLNDFENVLHELFEVIGNNEHAQKLKQIISQAFVPGRKYGDAMQDFLHALLGKYGLIVFQMDDPELKKAFIPIMKDELLHGRSKSLIEKTQAEIAHLQRPATFLRDINLFYLSENGRDRMDKEGDEFLVHLKEEVRYSESQWIEELEKHPDRFSPNVNMRPIYQELILPNIAYIGGGGEIAYWLERRRHFEHYNIPMPVLVRRDSAFWIDKNTCKKMGKVGLSFETFTADTDAIISSYVAQQASASLSIDEEKDKIEEALHTIAEKAALVDATLGPAFEAEAQRLMKSLESMASRIVRAEKHKHDVTINQIRQIKEKLFPAGKLQERHENFISLYLTHGDQLFDILLDQFDPLLNVLKIIREEG